MNFAINQSIKGHKKKKQPSYLENLLQKRTIKGEWQNITN